MVSYINKLFTQPSEDALKNTIVHVQHCCFL